MGFEQYHEPAAELSAETRTFARMITSTIEEAEATSWYEQALLPGEGPRRFKPGDIVGHGQGADEQSSANARSRNGEA